MTKYTVVVDPGGYCRHLVEDSPSGVYDAFGTTVSYYRNSRIDCWKDLRPEAQMVIGLDSGRGRHAENPLLWWADMLDVSDYIVLGPFLTRGEALAAEKAWLLEHNLPIPKQGY